MSHNLLIPVLRTASCHHDYRRKFCSFFGKSECSREIDSVLFVSYRDFFAFVRERRLRFLRAFGAACFSFFQIQRQRNALCECSANTTVVAQLSFVRSVDNRCLHSQYGIFERSGLRLYSVSPLVGAVECRYVSAFSCLIDMEYKGQRTGGNSQFSVPGS